METDDGPESNPTSHLASRGKKPEVNREDIEVGAPIEVYVKPGRKDALGWRRNCTVISIDHEGNIDYRWQGTIKKTSVHLTRPPAQDLGIFHVSDPDGGLIYMDEMKFLMDDFV